MAQEFISEYGLDPAEYVERLGALFCERCSRLSETPIEEAIFVDDGPVDYLVWFVLEDYEHHTFFYHDDDPDRQAMQRLILLSPAEHEMPEFRQLLKTNFGIYRELDVARLYELPDTYMPQLGERPRMNLGICHEPSEDRVVSGLSAIPRRKEQEIFDDVDKLVPDSDVETFISRTVQTLHSRVEENARRHELPWEAARTLIADPDCRRETTKPVPDGIHPKYAGEEAELWQIPASRMEVMDGSQGFLQLWVPVDEAEVALVNATAGKYDEETIIEAVAEEFTPATP